jgi:hypothetical protein
MTWLSSVRALRLRRADACRMRGPLEYAEGGVGAAVGAGGDAALGEGVQGGCLARSVVVCGTSGHAPAPPSVRLRTGMTLRDRGNRALTKTLPYRLCRRPFSGGSRARHVEPDQAVQQESAGASCRGAAAPHLRGPASPGAGAEAAGQAARPALTALPPQRAHAVPRARTLTDSVDASRPSHPSARPPDVRIAGHGRAALLCL